jgi:hypothetical protein
VANQPPQEELREQEFRCYPNTLIAEAARSASRRAA